MKEKVIRLIMDEIARLKLEKDMFNGDSVMLLELKIKTLEDILYKVQALDNSPLHEPGNI